MRNEQEIQARKEAIYNLKVELAQNRIMIWNQDPQLWREHLLNGEHLPIGMEFLEMINGLVNPEPSEIERCFISEVGAMILRYRSLVAERFVRKVLNPDFQINMLCNREIDPREFRAEQLDLEANLWVAVWKLLEVGRNVKLYIQHPVTIFYLLVAEQSLIMFSAMASGDSTPPTKIAKEWQRQNAEIQYLVTSKAESALTIDPKSTVEIGRKINRTHQSLNIHFDEGSFIRPKEYQQRINHFPVVKILPLIEEFNISTTPILEQLSQDSIPFDPKIEPITYRVLAISRIYSDKNYLFQKELYKPIYQARMALVNHIQRNQPRVTSKYFVSKQGRRSDKKALKPRTPSGKAFEE